jgi:SAM-dependent methyltransferase
MQSPHELQSPSPWVERWAPLVRTGGDVLDVACGYGRHARYFAARGHTVVAVDRDESALAMLAQLDRVWPIRADLEAAPWPFAADCFDAVIVTNYLHRPLFPHLTASLRDRGVLIYETFMVGNERFGKPSNPHFLLHPTELLQAMSAALHVVAFEQGDVTRPKPATIQRLCAVRGAGNSVTI